MVGIDKIGKISAIRDSKTVAIFSKTTIGNLRSSVLVTALATEIFLALPAIDTKLLRLRVTDGRGLVLAVNTGCINARGGTVALIILAIGDAFAPMKANVLAIGT